MCECVDIYYAVGIFNSATRQCYQQQKIDK